MLCSSDIRGENDDEGNGDDGPCGVSMFIETADSGEETYLEIPEME